MHNIQPHNVHIQHQASKLGGNIQDDRGLLIVPSLCFPPAHLSRAETLPTYSNRSHRAEGVRPFHPIAPTGGTGGEWRGREGLGKERGGGGK